MRPTTFRTADEGMREPQSHNGTESNPPKRGFLCAFVSLWFNWFFNRLAHAECGETCLVTGGHYLSGGIYGTGNFYAPAVLLDCTDNMAIAQEEIFGPAAHLLTFESEDEVIQRANATKFGLASYFYTRDMARVVRVAERLEYGLVGVNDAAGYTHEIPFGGFKESGLGREGGHEGIAEYTEVKSVVVNLA